MPVRLVRPWCDSDRVDQLGDAAEVFFLRLIMCADDFGRFTADPRLLKAALYPLRDIRNADITRLMQRCEHSGLIAVYNGADGKPYAAIRNFGQRMRAKVSKYPAPPEEVLSDPIMSHDSRMTGICQSHDSRMTARDEDEDGDEKRERDCAPAHEKNSSEIFVAAESIATFYPKEKVGDYRKLVEVVASAIGREITAVNRDTSEAIATVKSGTLAYADAVKLWKDKSFISTPERFYNSGMYNHDPETFKREAKGTNGRIKAQQQRYNPADPSTWGEA